ncbi:helix-turn-helix transcriptional regulator [Hasllibacter halocynthiae]|uniref:helix-turn-helix transcriptional regulator n=1 Tax=Hasllibacter halocynthiae TaxID=595589 RepID=UPI00130493E5|nr:AraC family transcriptional regulator [Hasllibacter halocynthiae]
MDTAALGLVPGTPLLGLIAFDSEPGHQSPDAVHLHRMLIFTGTDAVPVIERRDGRRTEAVVGRGDIVLFPAGTRAGLEWSERAQGIGITVDPATMSDFVRREMKVLVRGLCCEGETIVHDDALLAVAEALRDAVRPEGPGRKLIFDSMARVFLATLVRRRGVLSDAAAGMFGEDRWRMLVEHVGARLSGNVTPGEMARVVGMSESAFRRALRAATGLAPSAWLRGERVAATLPLLEQGHSLGEIAARCGFADQSHFTRTFKAAHGLTPSAWRRRGA